MRRREEYRYVHRWFVLQLGARLARRLERKMSEALASDAGPVRDGLVDELLPTLLYAHQLALGMEHADAGDVWIASGAIELIEELWPLVASLGWPAPGPPCVGCARAGCSAWRAEPHRRCATSWRT